MADAFDVYHKWLGIPPKDQPPHNYRLLALEPFEDDPEVIDAGANRLMAYIQQRATGQHAALSQKLLNEISAARMCLLDPAKKADYDARLRDLLNRATAPPIASAPLVPSTPLPAQQEDQPEVEWGVPSSPAIVPRTPSRRQRASVIPWKVVSIVSSGVVGLYLALVILTAAGKNIPESLRFLPGLGGKDVAVEEQESERLPQQVASPPPEATGSAVRLNAADVPPPPPRPAMPVSTATSASPSNATATVPAADPAANSALATATSYTGDVRHVPPAPPTTPAPATPPIAPAPGKRPIPDSATLEQALAKVREEYKTDYESARTDADKLALAQRMLTESVDVASDPAIKFTLLRISKDLAVQSGNPRVAMQVIDELEGDFEIDALAMKAEALVKTASVTKAPDDLIDLIDALMDECVSQEGYPPARQLAEATLVLKKNVRPEQLSDDTNLQLNEIIEREAAFAKVQKALAVLSKTPLDPSANLIVGRFRCFVQDDWDRGVQLLAAGSDQMLKRVAQQDIAQPDGAQGQLSLGDAWWEIGERESGAAQMAVKSRAAIWYRRALPFLTDALRPRLVQRLADLEAGSAATSDLEAQRLEAIDLALKWIVNQQQPAGNWSFAAGSNPAATPITEAATAMALIPLLNAGSTHEDGEYKASVAKGIVYLVNSGKKQPSGSIQFGNAMYQHGFAAIALCEAYRRTDDTELRKHALGAIDYIAFAQDPRGGGWRYEPQTPGDTSVLGWQLSALVSASGGGIQVPTKVLAGVSKFLDGVQSTDGSRYGYMRRPDDRKINNTTMIGLLSRYRINGNWDHPGLKDGVSQVANSGPLSQPNAYGNYYGTLLLAAWGGDTWERWRDRMWQQLFDTQEHFGADVGSWSPIGWPHQEQAGRLGMTCFCLTTLQIEPNDDLKPNWSSPNSTTVAKGPTSAKKLPLAKQPQIVATWEHKVDNGRYTKLQLYSNGRIGSPEGKASWSVIGDTLTLRWPNSKAPGGAWIDREKLSPDRRTGAGRNQSGNRIQGRLANGQLPR